MVANQVHDYLSGDINGKISQICGIKAVKMNHFQS